LHGPSVPAAPPSPMLRFFRFSPSGPGGPPLATFILRSACAPIGDPFPPIVSVFGVHNSGVVGIRFFPFGLTPPPSRFSCRLIDTSALAGSFALASRALSLSLIFRGQECSFFVPPVPLSHSASHVELSWTVRANLYCTPLWCFGRNLCIGNARRSPKRVYFYAFCPPSIFGRSFKSCRFFSGLLRVPWKGASPQDFVPPPTSPLAVCCLFPSAAFCFLTILCW